jgi:signal transduction histidine kinase
MITHFRSQARVIDLLGREQIADSPTAIGEVFKNALDAAARNVWVDYQDQSDLLVIRDDGLGMRYSDVVDKWLVLATDSSHRLVAANAAWAKFADKKQKQWLNEPRYGEKGIGRLSISILGRFALLWSVWGSGANKTGTLCLVHWHLFRHPQKLFEELPIPCVELKKPATRADIAKLVKTLRDSKQMQDLLGDKTWNTEQRKELAADLDSGFDLAGDQPLSWNNGTTFFIRGLSEHVPELFEKRNRKLKPHEELSPDALKSYHAFSTFWDPFHEHTNGRDFQIHASVNGKPLPDTSRYWNPQDFTRSDHHIRIEVDENGFASGILRNYGKKTVEYRKRLKSLPKGHRNPGKFVVEIGYLQGTQSYSQLSADDYTEIEQRLEHAGGFSIYVNNVRVQPYGTADNDFSGFDARRLKNAGRYYFSSRRMYGGIFIPSLKGTELREKAGREGFIANGARRGLRFWIEDLFIDLADSFYGSNADRPDKKASKLRRQKEDKTRKRLEEEKKLFLKNVRSATKQHETIIRQAKDVISELAAYKNSENNASPGTYLAEMRLKLDQLRKFGVELYDTPDVPPIGVVLEGDEQTSVEIYRSKRAKTIQDLNKRIQLLSMDLDQAGARHLDYKERVKLTNERIESARNALLRGVDELIAPVILKHASIEGKIRHIGTEETKEVLAVFDEALKGLTAVSVVSDATHNQARVMEEGIQKSREFFEEVVKPRLTDLSNEIDNLLENASSAVLAQSLADEVTRLKERETYLVELAQLGLITETATHEHENHVIKILDCVRDLRKKLDGNNLKTVETLASSFEIVDTRMRMFDPLIRRSGALSSTLNGKTIGDFLRDHFREYFDDGTIELTEAFGNYETSSVKIPVFLGAVYNLVHNAVYWCRKGTAGIPKIRLSSGSQSLVVSDSGPGVSPRDSMRIFDPGFSRKPYGRGLGLFIASEALKGIGYELLLASEAQLGALEGANFVIIKQETTDDDE